MKLLVFDVEGTLFKTTVRLPGTSIDSTIWQGIAHALGPGAINEEVETHKKWERGEYQNYLAWMEDTIEIHRKYGLMEGSFKGLISAAEYNSGVVATLNNIDRTKYEIVLVSGGFRELAARAQKDCFIKHAFAACEYFFGSDGYLTAYNLLPCDFAGKIDFIYLLLKEHGLTKDDWIFVGDGINDIPIAKQASVSIGYRPHRDLEDVVTHSITEFEALPNILD